MRRIRANRGPSSAEIIRQAQVRKLLFKYGSYSRPLAASSCCSAAAEYSSAAAASRSTATQLSSSSMHLASSSRRSRQVLHEDDNVKVTMKPSQLLAQGHSGQMDKGLALAAAQYVSRVLSEGDTNTVEAQQVKEALLHQLEKDYGFAGPETYGLGRIRITIKRKDNDVEIMRRRAELEKAELERKRLEERSAQTRRIQSTAVASSQEYSSSSTKIVKTRVVKKTVKRTVQTVRAA